MNVIDSAEVTIDYATPFQPMFARYSYAQQEAIRQIVTSEAMSCQRTQELIEVSILDFDMEICTNSAIKAFLEAGIDLGTFREWHHFAVGGGIQHPDDLCGRLVVPLGSSPRPNEVVPIPFIHWETCNMSLMAEVELIPPPIWGKGTLFVGVSNRRQISPTIQKHRAEARPLPGGLSYAAA